MIANLAAFLCWTGAAFVLGTWWGLFLNVTHLHRFRRWAERVTDRLDIK